MPQTTTVASLARADSCELRVADQRWAFADAHAAAINAHWTERKRTNPGFFNGPVHLMVSGTLTCGHFTASFLRTDFKSFLYWRETGYPPADAYDAFGSALIRSSEGHVLLGRQSAGNINAGLAYMPGGFIDDQDVGPDRSIDIAASISREVVEETGLAVERAEQLPGFLIVRLGALVSFVREFRFPQSAVELRRTILDRLSREAKPELADIVIMRTMADIKDARVPDYTARALATVLPP